MDTYLALLFSIFMMFFAVMVLIVMRLKQRATELEKIQQMKARVGLTASTGSSENEACFLCDLGKLLMPLMGTEAKKLRKLLLKAGYKKPYHLWMFVAAKFAFICIMLGLTSLLWLLWDLSVIWVILSGIVGLLLPESYLKKLADSHQSKVSASLPDFLDMCNVAIGAGLSYLEALKRVSVELKVVHPELCAEIKHVLDQLEIGVPRVLALKELAENNPSDDMETFVEMLIQNEKLGAPIGQALYEMTRRMYARRQDLMEERAAKTSAKMAIVIMPFFLIPFMVLIVGENIVMLGRNM